MMDLVSALVKSFNDFILINEKENQNLSKVGVNDISGISYY